MATTPEAPVATRSKYEPVIGLEVHVQLLTRTKIFCGCSTRFGDPPNTNVCPVCLGLPGALPVLNRQAVEFAVLAAMALNCRINETSIFARKNYFYPDLPKGYQISQYDKPLAEHGYIEIKTRERAQAHRHHARAHGRGRGQEPARRLPDCSEWTSIDLNRSGVPLIEIVSEPDIASPDEAYEYLTQLKEIILYTGVSDCNMEEGSLRCDANVSIRPRGQTRVRHQDRGQERQFLPLHSPGAGVRDRAPGAACSSRAARSCRRRASTTPPRARPTACARKEQAHDYRYFPEPDLLPLVVDEKWRDQIAANLPELPEARRARMVDAVWHHRVRRGHADRHALAGRPVRRGRRRREESQARGQPGAERVDGPAEGQGAGDRAVADLDEGRGDVGRPGRERRHQRQDAEGTLRHRASSAAKIFPPSTRARSRSRSPTPPRSRRSSTR